MADDPFAVAGLDSTGSASTAVGDPFAVPGLGSPADAASAKLDALLAQPAPKKSSGGFFSRLKSNLGSLVSTPLEALDIGRSTLVSAGKQLGNLGAAALGEGQDNPDFRPSLGNFFGDIQNHIGAGQVVQQAFPDANPWVKRAAGGALDLSADPLNAVTFGSGTIAKEGLERAGQVIGDQAARDALRAGGVEGLRAAVEAGGPQTLEEVLARGTGDLGKKTAEEVAQDRLTALAKNGKGGLGFGGLRTGIGQETAEKLGSAIKGSDVYHAVAPLFKPTAAVEAELGKGAADVTSQAVHNATAARMEARNALASTAATMDPAVYKATVQAKVGAAIGTDLVHDAPEIARLGKTTFDAAQAVRDGFKQLPGTDVFVHPAVADALHKAISTPPSQYVNAFDKINSVVKQLTVFGPLNGVQHDAKRTMFNHLAAVMYGGATNPETWKESWAARNAIKDLAKSGEEITAESLARTGLSEQAAKRAEALYHGVLTDNPMFESTVRDAGDTVDAAGMHTAKGVLGTRTAAKYAEADGELSRGAVFLQALDDGKSASVAAAKTRASLLDFSNSGLTPFERDKLQRAIFFYKFPRRAIPAGVNFALEHPGEANIASRLGVGIQQGARNVYGQHIGLAPDAPLETAFGGLSNLVKSPVDYVLGQANPAVTAVLNPKKRGISDILPPIGQAESRLGHAQTADNPLSKLAALGGVPLTPGSIPLPGFTSGGDTVAETAITKDQTAQAKYEAEVQQRQAAHQLPTTLQTLTAMAVKAGVLNPYSQTEKALLQSLSDKGIARSDLLAALGRKTSATLSTP